MFEQMPEWGTRVIPLVVFIICNVVGIITSKFIFKRIGQISQRISGIYYEVIIHSLRGMPVVWGGIIGSYSAVHLVEISPYGLHLLEEFLELL